MINGWTAEALNTAPDSANEIHGDDVAQQYGFKGGLVPGVTVSAYLCHPAVVAWGEDFLRRGHAHVRVGSPLYDGEQFSVKILKSDDSAYEAELARPDGTVSASAEVSLKDLAEAPPTRRGDPVADKDYVGPPASFEVWERLRAEGCKALRYHWGAQHRMQTYLKDASLMPPLHGGDEAYANMGYILGISNWILATNAHMNPWVHLETTSQNYQPVANDTSIVTEMEVIDFYEKKGHEFVDGKVALYNEADDSCLATIDLRAIYRLRGL